MNEMILRVTLALILILPLQAAWLKQLDQAQAQAAAQKKDLYLVFTTLQVSGACVQLEKRVLSQEAFQKKAGERFILVHLDVPLESTPGMTSPLAVNQIIAQRFRVEAFPTAFYLNSEGVTYASESGAIIAGPEESASRLLGVADARVAQMQALKGAYEKEGLDRAKAIIEILKNAPRGGDAELYAGEMAELAKLDPEDSLGFQKPFLTKRGFQDLERALSEVFHKDSYDEVVKLVDLYVADFEPQGELLQKALFPKLAALNHGGQREAAMTAAAEVIAVDAQSPHGKLAAQILARLKAQ